eukprot:m.99883 g.99883  ORF g.99883 m.99883 type:complete len:330 (-) comp15363_c0_seq2:234-1223(-)
MAARVGSRLVVGGVCRAWVSRPMSSQPGTTDATPAADLVVHDNGTASFTFGNPASRLSLDVLEQLATAVQTAQQATSVRCLVLQSRGDVFSSGHNLRELQAASDAEVRHVFGVCSDVMRMIACADIPVMASVQGLATAAGCQLVASCDLAIASSAATFATPGVQIGLFCSTPGVALGRSVPRKQAMHMLLTGHPLTADQALQHGLVSQARAFRGGVRKAQQKGGGGGGLQSQRLRPTAPSRWLAWFCQLTHLTKHITGYTQTRTHSSTCRLSQSPIPALTESKPNHLRSGCPARRPQGRHQCSRVDGRRGKSACVTTWEAGFRAADGAG